MYDFYYNMINKFWPQNELIYTDTDSFIVNIFTEDVYKDMELPIPYRESLAVKSLNNKKLEEKKEEVKYIKDLFNFSDYPKDHPLHSDENKKVIGIPKDEYKGKVVKETTALKSKLYFVDVYGDKIIKKVKGITKATIKHQINIDDAKGLFNE